MSQVRILSSRWVSEIDERVSPKSALRPEVEYEGAPPEMAEFYAVHESYMGRITHMEVVDILLSVLLSPPHQPGEGWV